MQGDFGQPRPALLVQSDAFNAHATVTVLLVSSLRLKVPVFKVTVQPDEKKGLRTSSQVMVDKTMTTERDKLGEAFGDASDELMLEVSRSLAVFLGIAR